MDNEIHHFYDVIDKKDIFVPHKGLLKWCRQLGIYYGNILEVISKKTLQAHSRYILPENKHKIFTLVDFETGQEYDCIKNKSILIYFNMSSKHNNKFTKNISEIKKGKRRYISIGGHLLSLKGTSILPRSKTKSEHLPKIKQIRQQYLLQEKIKKNLYCNLRYVIKKQKTIKIDHTMNLIGCSIEFLFHYLQLKFQPKMTWDNYGKNGWEIDHIIPCSSFNMLDPDQQKRCFHYTNLQPLWKNDNVFKSNKLPDGKRPHNYNGLSFIEQLVPTSTP
jgi:hypothetical protein